jgi:hypothetical protein
MLGVCKVATLAFLISRITTGENSLWDTALIKAILALTQELHCLYNILSVVYSRPPSCESKLYRRLKN